MWKKAVGILLALSVAGAFFYYGLTSAKARKMTGRSG